MSELKKVQRLRENHKPIYAILWLLEKQSKLSRPVPSAKLGDLIEQTTCTSELNKKNYNRTCRLLVMHGMLSRHRDEQSGRPSFSLTEESRKIAGQCFIDVFKMPLEQFVKM